MNIQRKPSEIKIIGFTSEVQKVNIKSKHTAFHMRTLCVFIVKSRLNLLDCGYQTRVGDKEKRCSTIGRISLIRNAPCFI